MKLQADIDMTGLIAGTQAAMRFSKRTPAQVINTSIYWVAVNAKNAMPFVTPERVDTELSVISNPVIGKKGKALKNKKVFTPKQSKDAPLVALIVAARANPNSRYNRLTNSRYALRQNPFKGVSLAAGRAAMRLLIDKMVKARHRSGHFLMVGWIPAVRALLPFSVQKFMKGNARGFMQGHSGGGELGAAEPAKEGSEIVTASITNAVGMEGKNAASFNRALWSYGAPILQDAVDGEGVRQMEYAIKHAEKELEEDVRKFWG